MKKLVISLSLLITTQIISMQQPSALVDPPAPAPSQTKNLPSPLPEPTDTTKEDKQSDALAECRITNGFESSRKASIKLLAKNSKL